MGFSAVKFFQFRNFISEQPVFSSREVYLIGENGQGKSNCLEALYLLCYGSSFRAKNDVDMIATSKTEASVIGQYVSTNRVSHEMSVILKRREPKDIRLDDKRVLDRKEILLSIPCVIFSHEDLEFINGPPAKKRKFLNQTLCMYDLGYLDLLRNYKKVLHERNTVLRQKKTELLTLYDFQLAHYGFQIQEKRKVLVKSFNVIFQKYFQIISGLPGTIEIVYCPSWQSCADEKGCVAYLSAKQERDLLFRTTTSGVHRDQFSYHYQGADFCRIASTGQVRLLSIILRVAQAGFFTECSGRLPILLVDDVLLELDKRKRELFMKHLPEYEQAFFTFLPDEGYALYATPQTQFYQVENGRIAPWKKQATF